ncbi:hypothetical protein ABIE27_005272 [Paenibacillus sp. 4624]|jgi:hypothetical protein
MYEFGRGLFCVHMVRYNRMKYDTESIQAGLYDPLQVGRRT